MRKNVSSQRIGAQMVWASSGTIFTTSTLVYVKGDASTQNLGATDSGVATYVGQGYHEYVPTQGETNYDHIAFTFTTSGALPVTLNVYTRVMTVAEEARLVEGVKGIVYGNTLGGGSVTSVPTNFTEVTNDHFNGRTITFNASSGPLYGQSSPITDWVGSTSTFTVSTLTEAPTTSDTWVVT